MNRKVRRAQITTPQPVTSQVESTGVHKLQFGNLLQGMKDRRAQLQLGNKLQVEKKGHKSTNYNSATSYKSNRKTVAHKLQFGNLLQGIERTGEYRLQLDNQLQGKVAGRAQNGLESTKNRLATYTGEHKLKHGS